MALEAEPWEQLSLFDRPIEAFTVNAHYDDRLRAWHFHSSVRMQGQSWTQAWAHTDDCQDPVELFDKLTRLLGAVLVA